MRFVLCPEELRTRDTEHVSNVALTPQKITCINIHHASRQVLVLLQAAHHIQARTVSRTVS